MAKMKQSKGEKPMMKQVGKGMKAKNPMQTLKRIFSYLKPYKGRMAVILICLVLHIACSVGGTFLLGLITESYILPLAYQNGIVTDPAYAERAAVVTLESFGVYLYFGRTDALYVQLFSHLCKFKGFAKCS